MRHDDLEGRDGGRVRGRLRREGRSWQDTSRVSKSNPHSDALGEEMSGHRD